MEKTLGGDRLGSGKKQKVYLHGYERSTHDMGYIWRSTMASGTLVPFMSEVALPGDTFDINLDCDVKTHPTVGPLFGSYKVQLDIFQAPIRLYQGQLHNNKLGIGMNMANVKLPLIKLKASKLTGTGAHNDFTNSQINPSCILSYLNIRGIGRVNNGATNNPERTFNAIPLLAYWEIYKNYYANKQETNGYVIHATDTTPNETVDSVRINTTFISKDSANDTANITSDADTITIAFTGTPPQTWAIIFQTDKGTFSLEEIGNGMYIDASTWQGTWKFSVTGPLTVLSWRYIHDDETPAKPPTLYPFPLDTIDSMRESILAATKTQTAFIVNDEPQVSSPYKLLLDWARNNNKSPYINNQEGLGIKTYQSDLFNNWLSTEWIDGVGGINEITAIDTSSGSFNIDTLNLSKKVYDMLNRIAVSGGSYDDWLDAVYTHDRITRAESPIYHGGLIKELVFQEVVSNSIGIGSDGQQPLGTLAGKGTLAKQKKGGQITIKIDEPSYLIGIVSLTPRVDYSQGNKWDVHLETMDDLHKPALDQIGFQELITEQMAWFDTIWDDTNQKWIQKSAGKQPAWVNYMTNVNQVRGNFAIENNEMFMTLNRNYSGATLGITDLTTYIDPVKYNQIFAETKIDAQNFWTQIAVDITARRKMSAKVMPNL